MPTRIPYDEPIDRLKEYARTEAEREKKRFYSSTRWRKLRAHQLALEPLCRWCGRLADTAHHVVPRLEAPALAYTLTNLASSCSSCHSRHHAQGAPRSHQDDAAGA